MFDRTPIKGRMLTLRVDESEMDWLDQQADKLNIPRAAIVRAILARAYAEHGTTAITHE